MNCRVIAYAEDAPCSLKNNAVTALVSGRFKVQKLATPLVRTDTFICLIKTYLAYDEVDWRSL